tara:strand:+ start:537 stop:740 length:204 start_codon:yes stop_codon:yes gene_type:complete
MTYHFKIFALALLVSGCSALENKLTHYSDPLLEPPSVLEGSNRQLICETEALAGCEGFLTDKDIDLN